MVVEILVAQRDAEDPLGQHGLLVVYCHERVARVGDAGRQPSDQAQLAIRLPQQQPARVAGESAAIKIRHDFLRFETGKQDRLSVTLCHRRASLPCGVRFLEQPHSTRL